MEHCLHVGAPRWSRGDLGVWRAGDLGDHSTTLLSPGPMWSQLLMLGITAVLLVVLAGLLVALHAQTPATRHPRPTRVERAHPESGARTEAGSRLEAHARRTRAQTARPGDVPRRVSDTPRPRDSRRVSDTGRHTMPLGRIPSGERVAVTDIIERVRAENAAREHRPPPRRARPAPPRPHRPPSTVDRADRLDRVDRRSWWERELDRVGNLDTVRIPGWRDIRTDVSDYPTMPIADPRWPGRVADDDVPTLPVLPGIVHRRVIGLGWTQP